MGYVPTKKNSASYGHWWSVPFTILSHLLGQLRTRSRRMHIWFAHPLNGCKFEQFLRVKQVWDAWWMSKSSLILFVSHVVMCKVQTTINRSGHPWRWSIRASIKVVYKDFSMTKNLLGCQWISWSSPSPSIYMLKFIITKKGKKIKKKKKSFDSNFLVHNQIIFKVHDFIYKQFRVQRSYSID